MKKLIFIAGMVLLICLGFLTPFAIIFALNTLFKLNIAYDFYSYISIGILNLTWFYKNQFSKIKGE